MRWQNFEHEVDLCDSSGVTCVRTVPRIPAENQLQFAGEPYCLGPDRRRPQDRPVTDPHGSQVLNLGAPSVDLASVHSGPLDGTGRPGDEVWTGRDQL